MAFSGWPEEALDFYDGLVADNTKTYWTQHKAVYTEKILGPMTDLTEELAAEFGEPKIFRRYREAVAGDRPGAELVQIVDELEQADITVHGHGALKSAPRGYPADHPRITLLRYKGLTAWQQWPAGPWLEGAGARDRVVSFFRTTRPLASWLRS